MVSLWNSIYFLYGVVFVACYDCCMEFIVLPVCRMAEDERPVQGPLPADPDNAPWKRQESGIRRL